MDSFSHFVATPWGELFYNLPVWILESGAWLLGDDWCLLGLCSHTLELTVMQNIQ